MTKVLIALGIIIGILLVVTIGVVSVCVIAGWSDAHIGEGYEREA